MPLRAVRLADGRAAMAGRTVAFAVWIAETNRLAEGQRRLWCLSGPPHHNNQCGIRRFRFQWRSEFFANIFWITNFDPSATRVAPVGRFDGPLAFVWCAESLNAWLPSVRFGESISNSSARRNRWSRTGCSRQHPASVSGRFPHCAVMSYMGRKLPSQGVAMNMADSSETAY